MGFFITKDSIYVNLKYRQTLQQLYYPKEQNTNTKATRRMEQPQLQKQMFQEGYVKENGGWKVLQLVMQIETDTAEDGTKEGKMKSKGETEGSATIDGSYQFGRPPAYLTLPYFT